MILFVTDFPLRSAPHRKHASAAVTVVHIDPEMPRSGRAANALASLRSNSLGLRSGWSSAAVVLGRR
jgi:hypothetical protein